MNAVSLLLRVLAILGAIAAGVLFYMTNGRIAELTGDLAKAKSEAQAQVSTATENVKALQEELAKTAVVSTELNKEKTEAENNYNKSQTNLSDAQTQITKDEDALKAIKRQVQDEDQKIADLQKTVDSIPALNTQIADQQTQIVAQQAIIEDFKKNGPKPAPETPKTEVANINPGPDMTPTTPMLPANLGPRSPAKILSVDTKQWLIVLDVGSNNGVQKDAELYLKVGDQNLAIVKVRDTTPTMTTAAILSTEDIQRGNFSQIATKGLKIDFQRVAQ